MSLDNQLSEINQNLYGVNSLVSSKVRLNDYVIGISCLQRLEKGLLMEPNALPSVFYDNALHEETELVR